MATIQTKANTPLTSWIKQTRGGNNQFIWNNQWSVNALAWTWHVADLPTNIKTTTAPSTAKTVNWSNNPTEKTLWGNNYYFWDNNKQWQQNALVGTWAMAWIPEQPKLQTPEKWATVTGWTRVQLRQPQAPTPWVQTTQNRPSVWASKPVVNQTQNTQTTPYTNPEESPNAVFDENGNYMWSSDIAYSWTAPQQEQTQEEKPWMTLEDNKGWELYGRARTDKDSAIQTNEDPNSIENIMNTARNMNYTALQSMSSEDIATSINAWYSPYWTQAMRDLMQFDPAKYQEVQNFLKEQQGQTSVNDIMKDWVVKGTTVTKTNTDSLNSSVDTRASSVSSSPEQAWNMTNEISKTMASNATATSATQEMLNINKDIAEYEQKLKDLPSEAKKAFKWDVPQYVYQAYVSNKAQEYQSAIDKLEKRYNSAMDLYKTELSNAQWEAEMNLKERQFQQNVNNDNRTRTYQSMQLDLSRQNLALNSIKRDNGKAYQINSDWSITQLTDATAYNSYVASVNSAIQWYNAVYQDGMQGGQCETFTDNFTEAVAWIRMTWANGRWRTTAEEKVWYINEITPQVWDIAIWVGGVYNKQYWHTMLVTWYDPATQMITYKASNKAWEEQVYSWTMSLSKFYSQWGKWFWNPYKTVQEQSIASGENYMYEWFNTPMATAFQRLQSDKSLSVGQQNSLWIALEMYDTMYEIAHNWQLDALVDNWDLALIMKDIKNKTFSANDNWAWFADALYTAINNKMSKLAGWDDSYLALMALYRVVEAKLRDESWAAISSSEWRSNFSYLLPQAWESAYVKNNKLKSRDRIMSTKFIDAWGKMNEYVPVFQDSTNRQIRGN